MSHLVYVIRWCQAKSWDSLDLRAQRDELEKNHLIYLSIYPVISGN